MLSGRSREVRVARVGQAACTKQLCKAIPKSHLREPEATRRLPNLGKMRKEAKDNAQPHQSE